MAARDDPLRQYNAKRDFKATPEPAGKVSAKGGNRFIVQKHDATRLHYDFRLELDGVLKSWAVTKGPSANPDNKRLAVRTEDHPMAYADFEGVIPKGEYGGGTVMLWDRGTWEPVPGKSAKDLEKGHLHFTLQGERMKGEWLLIRLRPRPGEKRENWLLRKIDDAHAGGSDDLVGRWLTSVLTGRTMMDIAGDKEAAQSLAGTSDKAFAGKMKRAAAHNRKVAKVRKKVGLPKFRPVQLATLVDDVPVGNDWMHEIKFDGYRAVIAAEGSEVRVYTRAGLDWTDKFQPLARAVAALDLPSCLIDGEVVAFDAQGNPDFSSLQAVLKRGHGAQTEGTPLQYFAFDLLELEGRPLDKLGNLERKEKLAGLLDHAQAPIAVADHVIGAGEKLYRAMCEAGQEGIIAKRIDAAYHGKRSRNWVKVKCTLRQEFVITGWTPSSARARPFASLILAQWEDGTLVHKGNVGTGFDAELMDDLAKRFAKLEQDKPALEIDRAAARRVRWLKPELVAEVAFAEFTASGSVRHASFIGLRSDKPAREVQPERKAPAPKPESAIKISNRDRVLFPESKATKGDLADYYVQLAPLILPHLARRPLSLVRCPQGRAKKCFFQKHDSGSFGEHVHHVPIREKDGGHEDYLHVDTADGILACVQMGTIEFHGWGCHAETLEQPDRMVFDLDPDEELDFAAVRKAALDLRGHLSDMGLVSFAMLSGGKGVHIVVPLRPGHDWDTHKDFSRRLAEAMSQAEPDRFVANMSKARRKGRIFIDYLRNQRGSTAIMPYSARAREGAPVAVPVTWEELAEIEKANVWNIFDAEDLIERGGSAALKGWGFAEQDLPPI